MIDADILGGDKPFISPSAVPFRNAEMEKITGVKHTPFRIKIKGNDLTREVQWYMAAASLVIERHEAKSGMTEDEFLTGYLAGLNTDLLAMGIPLLSKQDVQEWADDPAFIASIMERKPTQGAASPENGKP